MEKSLEFNSQICTTREQSKRLLKLGLKKATADMVWVNDSYNTYLKEPLWRPVVLVDCEAIYVENHRIPAWSLHRLLSLLPTEIKCDVENGLGIYLGSQNDVSYFGVLGYYSCENLYDAVILCIEDVIKEGYFNQDYLEEKKL